MTYIRGAKHAGEWYPVDDTLLSMLEASFFYADPTPEQKQELRGIIAPHSSFTVSLRTAAHSYSRVNPDDFDKIVILGTCHHIPLSTCLISQASEVETPFGPIKVDNETASSLVAQYPSLFGWASQEVDENEHSLEMQYPLIKYVFKDRPITVLPIIVGSLSEELEGDYADILRPIVLGERTLFIISSDFTHFGELFRFTQKANPRRPLEKQMEIYDEKAINIIYGLNYEHFRFHIDEIKGSICGCYAIGLIMHILVEGFKVERFYRSELCQVKRPSDFSISYMAVGFYNDVPNDNEQEED